MPTAENEPSVVATPREPTPIADVIEILDAHPAQDLIFNNADILTMDSAQPAASAIAGDTILVVGQDDEILAMAAVDQASVVDLQRLTIMPGFIDRHSRRITQRANWCLETVEEASQEALSLGWTGLDMLWQIPTQMDNI